jgi:cell division protein FtsW
MSSFTERIFTRLRGDRPIWLVVALLSLASMLAVYSATGTLAYKYQGGNTEYYLFKHIVLIVGGWILMYLTHLIHYKKFANWSPTFLVLSIIFLVFTLAVGPDINGARRWITLPIIEYSFQASDLAKIGLILFVARMISTKQDVIKDLKEAFLPIIFPIILVCLLIAPANLSTALVLFFVCMLMMFIGRLEMKYIAALFGLGLVAFLILIAVGEAFPGLHIRSATWISRMRDFLGDDNGAYQVQQAKIAIAKGGFWGVGPGNSLQRNYLPHPYSDFIYSVIIEEYGLFGAFLVLALYLYLMFRVVRLVTLSPKAFGAMAAVGLGLLITIQALANMAVSVNMVPVTGQTLPLVSMGGNSVLFTCISLGIIQSISKFVQASKDDPDDVDD